MQDYHIVGVAIAARGGGFAEAPRIVITINWRIIYSRFRKI